jgi:hypothetical protein
MPGKLQERHVVGIAAAADILPQPVDEADRAGRRRPLHAHREVVGRRVAEIVLRPQVMAADQRLAAVDGDDLGVVPGIAVAILRGDA